MERCQLAMYPTTYKQEPLLCCIVCQGFALSWINHWTEPRFRSTIEDFLNVLDTVDLCDVLNWLSYCITIACPYFYDELIIYLQTITNRDVGLEIFKYTFPTKDTNMKDMIGREWYYGVGNGGLNLVSRVLFGEDGWFNDHSDIAAIIRGFDCICNIHPKTVQRGLIAEIGTEGTVLFAFIATISLHKCLLCLL